jgi:rRNA-processing protein FCF1
MPLHHSIVQAHVSNHTTTVDASFIRFAVEKRLYFREMLPKILQANAKPIVTRCIVTELRRMGQQGDTHAERFAFPRS